jgi:beta-1,4-N-acetylglucosaminyltransferase
MTMKICLVCSSGGHLSQIITLKKWWNEFDHFWVTFYKEDAISLLCKEKVYFGYYPTNRSIYNLIKNTFLAIRIILKEKPKIIFSTGAGIAIPFFFIGKIMGAKLIYLEVYDRISSSTLTGRLVYPLVDKFLVQWEEQKRFYPKAENWGQAI